MSEEEDFVEIVEGEEEEEGEAVAPPVTKKRDKNPGKGKEEKKPKKKAARKGSDNNKDKDGSDDPLKPGILGVIGRELQISSAIVGQGHTTDRIATTSERLVESAPRLVPKMAPRLDPPASERDQEMGWEGEDPEEDIIERAAKTSSIASGAAGMKRVIQIVQRLAEQRKLTDTLGMSVTPKESHDATTQILGRTSLLQAYSEMAMDWERFKYNPVIAPPMPVSVQNTFSRPKGPAATWERSCVMGRECVAYVKGAQRLRDIARGMRDPRESHRSFVATSKEVTGEDGETRKQARTSAASAFNTKPWPCREWVPSAVRADHERLRKAYLTAVSIELKRDNRSDPKLSPMVRAVLDEGAAYAQMQEYHHMCIQCYRTQTIKNIRKYKLFKQQRSDATPPDTPMTRDEHLRDDLRRNQPRVIQMFSDMFGCADGFNESCRFVVEDGYCGIIGDIARDDANGMVYTEAAYSDIDGTSLPAWLYCTEWLFR